MRRTGTNSATSHVPQAVVHKEGDTANQVAAIIKKLREELLSEVHTRLAFERDVVFDALRKIAKILATHSTTVWPLINYDDIVGVEFLATDTLTPGMQVYLRGGGRFAVFHLADHYEFIYFDSGSNCDCART